MGSLMSVVEACKHNISGTGALPGIPCRPSEGQIEEVCQVPPPGQPRPGAFKLILENQLGISIDRGVYCFDGICQSRNQLVAYDIYCWIGIPILILSTFVLRCILNDCI